MKHLRRILAATSLLPFTLVQYLLIILPMILLKQFRYLGRSNGIPVFDAINLAEKWMRDHGWAGACWIFAIIVVDDPNDYPRYRRTIIHELVHAEQVMRNGVLQLILYPLESARIFFFHKKLHSYYDNKYEVEARQKAGQRVHIPKEFWKDGPGDRWAWW